MRETSISILRSAGVIIGISALLSFFGVYGGYGEPIWLRMAMWLVTITTGAVASHFVVPFVFMNRFPGWPVIAQVLLTAAIISVPVTGSLLAFILLYGADLTASEVPVYFVYVFAITVILTFAGYAADRLTSGGDTPEDDRAATALAAFKERLPVRFRTARLLALSSEDHYLRVHTSLGSELILMRLGDAERELADAPGLRVHRSWWVAKDAVSDARRENGRLVLTLETGTDVPVSRSYSDAVREAGLGA